MSLTKHQSDLQRRFDLLCEVNARLLKANAAMFEEISRIKPLICSHSDCDFRSPEEHRCQREQSSGGECCGKCGNERV